MATILLDTNAYSEYRRVSQPVLEALTRAGRALICAAVMAELLYGLRAKPREKALE